MISEESLCVVSAFTGKAANNISGTTLHSTLFLPTTGAFTELKGMQLQTLQSTFERSSFLIIDEYSMVGLRLFGRIDSRLRQATGKLQEPFGGISVIIIGDILQLPPVKDKPVYSRPEANEPSDVQKGRTSFAAFRTVVELTKNERQNDPGQEEFRQFLMDLRKGQHDPEKAYNLLKSRMIGIAPTNVVQQFNDAICLNYSNNNVDRANVDALNKLKNDKNQRICRINAVKIFSIFKSFQSWIFEY